MTSPMAYEEELKMVVKELSKKYNFDEKEALKELNIKKEQKNIPLPFCNKILDGCRAVKYNYGLFTQCCKKIEESDLCKSCMKKESESDDPIHRIEERMKKGTTYRDEKGRQVVRYGNIMEKMGISREAAIATAVKYDLEIPETEFEIVKAKRGRPKKDTTTTTPTTTTTTTPPVKKRGRPRKEKANPDVQPGDKLIGELVATAHKKTENIENPKIVEEEEEEEEVEVVRIQYKGKEYFKDANNTVYNADGEEEGIWNETQQLIEVA